MTDIEARLDRTIAELSERITSVSDNLRERTNLLLRARDALNGMVGLVQLLSGRTCDTCGALPTFSLDNHRVIEAMSTVNAVERLFRECPPECGECPKESK